MIGPSKAPTVTGMRPAVRSYQLAVSSYDRVSSTLIALLILVGVFVTGLLIVFFTTRVFSPQKSVPVTLAEIATRAGDAALGMQRDLSPPGVEEMADLVEPQLQQSLTALSDAVSSQLALLHDEAWDAEVLVGQGSGAGDRRMPGSGAPGDTERVPRSERWQVNFSGSTLEDYARQLDGLGIELGVLGPDNQVHYVRNVARPTPDRRAEPPNTEQRFYMTWRAGPLIQADRRLLAKAGMAHQGRQILHFYSAALEAELAGLELQHAEGRHVNEIRRTIFGIKQEADRYTFYVVDQKYF